MRSKECVVCRQQLRRGPLYRCLNGTHTLEYPTAAFRCRCMAGTPEPLAEAIPGRAAMTVIDRHCLIKNAWGVAAACELVGHEEKRKDSQPTMYYPKVDL